MERPPRHVRVRKAFSLGASHGCPHFGAIPTPCKKGNGHRRQNARCCGGRWAAILLTGYAKSHGFFPSPETALAYKDWGGLAQIGFGKYISNERAIIMIAHIHALAVSACAAWGPQILGDSLTLLDGEEDEVCPPLFILTVLACLAAAKAVGTARGRGGGAGGGGDWGWAVARGGEPAASEYMTLGLRRPMTAGSCPC